MRGGTPPGMGRPKRNTRHTQPIGDCTMIFALLLSQAFAGALICNDGTQSPSCSVCRAGCCSYHGGCSGYAEPSRSYPSYPPAPASSSSGWSEDEEARLKFLQDKRGPPTSTAADAAKAAAKVQRASAWKQDIGVNHDGTLVLHSADKKENDVTFGYVCYARSGVWIGAAVFLWLAPPSGKTWPPQTGSFVTADTGTGRVVVDLVSGNSITRILSWGWEVEEWGEFSLIKTAGGMDPRAGEAQLTVDELVRFSTADFVQVRVGEEVYRLSLQGSQAAIAAADAACTR